MDSVVYVLFLALVSLPWMCSSVSCETLRDFESHTYPYSGAPEIFISPENGTYRVELWGASANGGPGAYVRGDISLAAGEKLYVYVGGTGIVSMNDPDIVVFNGGGRAGLIMGDSAPGGIGFSTGAGATDMRLRGGAWDDQSSLLSRIMVAAGSGGSWGVKGHAGGLTGYDAPSSRYQASYVTYG
ncbi:MAG: hypothetical protein LBT31_06990, partial [Synergistaceae bacterium]|nr:hypothetical protein [Synergistaceae bacterium]